MICVGGASSSGTTLVADLLDSVPGIGCPPELYIFSDPGAYEWDDAFVAAALARRPRPNPSAHVLPHTWFNHKHLPSCGLDDRSLDRMIGESPDLRSFCEGFRHRFEVHRDRPIEVLAEKTPINVNLADTWCRAFPDGLFVHVVRHPWSVIASLGRRGFPPLQAGLVWTHQVRAGLAARKSPNCILLRYEDVLEAPFECMADIASRVGIDADPKAIEEGYRHNEYRASLGRVQEWKASTFDGEVHAESSPTSPAESDLMVLEHLWVRSEFGVHDTDGGLVETAREVGYDLERTIDPNPAVLERAFGTAYAGMLSSPRRGTLLKPVDPVLRPRHDATTSRLVRTASQREPGTLRVLHGVLGQAGQPSMLANALRRRGLVAASCRLAEHGLGFESDLRLDLDRARTPNLVAVLRRIARDFDVVHLHGSSFASPATGLPLNIDLMLLRLLGVKIVWHCRGTDSRLETEFRRAHPHQELYDPATFRGFAKPDAYRRERVLLRESICDHMLVVDEEMRSYIPDGEIVRRAIDLEAWPEVGPDGDRPGRVVIVHAPSREIYKGTEPLEAAIERLVAEGLPIEYRRVTGVPNDEAREIYKTADIVVDQLMIGWYGVLAVEAMALGKPVVAFIRPDLERHASDLPIVNAGIDDIEQRLRELVTDRDRRRRLGARNRRFVEENHCSNRIAAQLEEIYRRPRRPLEGLDWASVWERIDALARQDQQPLKDRNRELNAEVKQLRKQLKAAEEAQSFSGGLVQAIRRRIRGN